jgi:hypothetical protein
MAPKVGQRIITPTSTITVRSRPSSNRQSRSVPRYWVTTVCGLGAVDAIDRCSASGFDNHGRKPDV